MAAHQAPPSLGFSRQEHWSGFPFPSPMHEVKSKSEVVQSCLTQRPHALQPTRLLCPWDFPGKSTRVGCHCLLWDRQADVVKNKWVGFWPTNTLSPKCGCLVCRPSIHPYIKYIYRVLAMSSEFPKMMKIESLLWRIPTCHSVKLISRQLQYKEVSKMFETYPGVWKVQQNSWFILGELEISELNLEYLRIVQS